MNIIKRMEEVKTKYDNLLKARENLKNQISSLEDEEKRMQGEYRLLISLGVEEGILDEKGNLIVKPEVKLKTPLKEVKKGATEDKPELKIEK